MATDITSVNSSCSQSDIHGDTNTDVSALKIKLTELEKELKNLQAELNHSLDNTGCAIRVINKDYTIRHINQAFADISEVKQAEVIGKKCWDVFASPFCHTPNCRLKCILQGEKSIQIEIVRQRKDNTSIPCSVTANPLYNAEGELVGIIEQFRDITERQLLLQQLRESEERYRSLINLGAEAGEAFVMLQDKDYKEGIQTFVSDQWSHITGYTKEELLGTCFFDLVSDNDREFSIERHRQKMSGKATPGMFEMNIVRSDGTEVTIELSGAFTTYQGKRANVIYLRDITDRKRVEHKIRESEELYRDLFQNVPMAIIEFDFSEVKKYYEQLRANGVTDFRDLFFTSAPDELLNCEARLRVTRMNNQAVRMYDMSSPEEYMSIMVQVHKEHATDDRGPRECHVGLAEGKTYFNYEDSYQTVAGDDTRSLHTWVSVAPGCENSLSKVYVCFVDITALKQAERELIRYKEHLEEIVEKRTAELQQSRQREQELFQIERNIRQELEVQLEKRVLFSRAIVHELKTPLTPMLVASEILAQQQDNEFKPIAQTLYEGAVALDKRIDELLDIARGEIGMLSIKPEPCDIVNLVKKVVEDTLYMFESRSQTLTLSTDETSVIITIDPERIRQVLVNLLDNASKFTPKGGRITVKIKVEKNRLLIEVEDTGLGIPDCEREKIFEPYYSLKEPYQSHTGIGIGLALAKMLVKLHGGDISNRSAEDHGSIFSFFLPITNKVCA